jgi:hypothetical protein
MGVVVIQGADRVQKMLDRFHGAVLKNRLRRAVRAGAKPFQEGLKAAASSEPTGNVPASFKKVPAAKVSASARLGGDIVARVRPKSPLFNVFEPGAGAHEISGEMMAGPAGAGGWSQAGRKRAHAFGARGRVRHPGMKARPILPTAFSSKLGDAQRRVAAVIFEEVV